MSTRVTIENENGAYSVEVPEDAITLDKLVAFGVGPAMLAAGYHPGSVEKKLGTLFCEDEPCLNS